MGLGSASFPQGSGVPSPCQVGWRSLCLAASVPDSQGHRGLAPKAWCGCSPFLSLVPSPSNHRHAAATGHVDKVLIPCLLGSTPNPCFWATIWWPGVTQKEQQATLWLYICNGALLSVADRGCRFLLAEDCRPAWAFLKAKWAT